MSVGGRGGKRTRLGASSAVGRQGPLRIDTWAKEIEMLGKTGCFLSIFHRGRMYCPPPWMDAGLLHQRAKDGWREGKHDWFPLPAEKWAAGAVTDASLPHVRYMVRRNGRTVAY